MTRIHIREKTINPVLNIALDTLERRKQALIFVGSKAGAEKTAEEIAKEVKREKIAVDPACKTLSGVIETAIPNPTKQCRRLALCVEQGIAFHHAGLVQKQKTALEDGFRYGHIRIICCTPTLAIGVDLPAYRAVIRDLKRFSKNWGSTYIPVLEYHQMSGRAGRPGKDILGEAITIAGSEAEKEAIYEQYVTGTVEDIYSKLAVEPVLRTYLLSLIATEVVTSKKQIMTFFGKTFWAHQYHDFHKLEIIIAKMLKKLIEWGFIQSDEKDFASASEMNNTKYKTTTLGRRVTELYLDPFTAYRLIFGMQSAASKVVSSFTLLHLVCDQLELRPLLTVKKSEYDSIEEILLKHGPNLLVSEPSTFDSDYDYFLRGIKTALFFSKWIEEIGEDTLLQQYSVRPGELHAKKERMIWLLHATIELSKLLQLRELGKELHKLHFRVEYGVKEELFGLLRLKNIGRVRARKLHNNKIRTLGEVKEVDITILAQLIGNAVALDIKKQVGINISTLQVKPTKRKGQMSLEKYSR